MGFRLIDIICPACKREEVDVRLEPGDYPECEDCGTTTERLWKMGSSASVIGDECDVTIRHGICHDDGTPRRYRSKSEMARVTRQKNLQPYVAHAPERGTDKSKHTTRWT